MKDSRRPAGNSRRIVTEEDVRSLPEGSLLDLPPRAILTDVAREWIEKKKIRVVVTDANAKGPGRTDVAIGSDHAGLNIKEHVKSLLAKWDVTFTDYGTHSSQSVDYPDFAHAVAQAVALGHSRLGIVVDGAGLGSSITANKVPGIRAAPCWNATLARNAREHNDVNVLTLGARVTPRDEFQKIVEAFLHTELSEPRHRARVRKIEGIEKKYYRPV